MTATEANVDVTVYTKSNCPQCVSTKELMKKLAIPYKEINIEENPDVLTFLKAEGFRSAPVVMTEADAWAGFNETKIRSLVASETTDDDWDF